MKDESSVKHGGLAARVAAIAKKNTHKLKTEKSKQQSLAAALQREQEQQIPNTPPQIPLQLPLFPQDKSAMPHKWTRSSLFMSVAAGGKSNLSRPKYVKTRLASRNDLTLFYTGEQLDMADNDVFLHAIRLAQGQAAGAPIYFVRSQFLEAIGRTTGTSGYKWLKDSLQRLASATLFIENADGDGKMFRLIKELSWKRQNEEFWLSLDSEIVQFFGKHELAHIDFQARLELRAPLAKWLQNYASGHRSGDWHHVSVENLRVWSGSGEMRNFMGKGRGLPKALEELVATNIIEEYEFYETKTLGRYEKMVKWWRPSDFGKWLRNYTLAQPAGWYQVDVDELLSLSQYRTLKSFLAVGRGLRKALSELEKSLIIDQSEIYYETTEDNNKLLRVRWLKLDR
ncbi:replication initiator protein A [Azomonas agilis]|uniref:Replication initiator protein A n=1 Tax=Azomonas agilis TaxID=116849 RepID=A0A562IYR3_9GAMM|nr:plasmid replication initiator TrfA [Azomonas agilis]TWH76022.1 replication initiator protein A [Azomonas agilis]